jgi:serine/threonine protein kinase
MALADRFVLGERAGMGATGEVVRAFDKDRGIDVAIKRLHDHLVADPFSRDRFRCETALAARVDSDHVVRCLEGGVDEDDRPYLVLEWLDGQDLAERMKASRVSVPEAIEITRQTALGLQAMHDAGIVHRDVKPRNLFVTQQPGKPFVVKLLDLGVAHDTTCDQPAGTTLGTPFYMSPEQAQASGTIGPASDLFSLGILFYELLAGRRPFAGATTFSLLAKIALQVTPRLSEAWPNAPRVLDAFVARVLARDPASRFSSARELATELDRLAPLVVDAQPLVETDDTPSVVPNPDHLVAVVFGRLPLSSNVDQCREQVRKILHAHTGSLVPLLGRGVVGVFQGWCADGLLCAADAALALAQMIAGSRWSLVSGPTLPPGLGLSESMIERGTQTLERTRTGANEACVRIDDETANLLEEHYVIEGVSGLRSLRSVREARSAQP